jgi:hypothetical protein
MFIKLYYSHSCNKLIFNAEEFELSQTDPSALYYTPYDLQMITLTLSVFSYGRLQCDFYILIHFTF